MENVETTFFEPSKTDDTENKAEDLIERIKNGEKYSEQALSLKKGFTTVSFNLKTDVAKTNKYDAFTTALVWAETSILLTCADIITTKAVSEPQGFTKKEPTSSSITTSKQYNTVFQDGRKYIM